MPSFEDMKRLNAAKGTVAQQVKRQSDYGMEATWDNNVQSKLCYIYDYAHDDHPELVTNIPHSPYTSKTAIDAKFIVSKYWTISSDQPEYHLEFKPSQPLEFKPTDDLYYYETDYRQKYGMTFPVGMYIDIPDERGVYERWLIWGKHGGNQYTKFSVLKCDYYLHWIEFVKNSRIKRKMWCVLRSQSSYNAGLWTNDISTVPENQSMFALPLNPISENFFYVNSTDKMNQRVVISAPTKYPIVWQISKVANTNPLGIQIVTGYQDKWNPDSDYIDTAEQAAGDMFAMYANYNSYTVVPTDPVEYSSLLLALTCNSNEIKAGGSYKLITAMLYNKAGQDMTDLIQAAEWTCTLNGEDITDSELVTWLAQDNMNEMKIKFAKVRNHYTEILTIQCTATLEDSTISGEIQLEIAAL